MPKEVTCSNCGGSGEEYREIKHSCCSNPKCEACGGLGFRFVAVPFAKCGLCNGKGVIKVD